MDKTTKHAAGGIVLDPKTEKILLTKKLSKKTYIAHLKKLLYHLLRINPENVIKRFKLGTFTKGKREKGMTKKQTAIQEIEEEGGIKATDIIEHKYLGLFFKKKAYGFKEIDMFLYILTKEYTKLKPTDKRHIAAFVELEKAEKYLQNEEEKNFFLQIKDEIIQTLLVYKDKDKDKDILSMEEKKDVTESDLGVKR